MTRGYQGKSGYQGTGSHRRGSKRGKSAGRQDARPREPKATPEPQELDAELGLPVHLIEAVRCQYGEKATRIETGWACSRRVTLRANTLLASAEQVASDLDAAGIAFTRVPWYEDAFVLADGARERDLWDLDMYKQGKIYLQSLSSMLPPLALSPRAGADILDMCAAPGGKTSQMAALAPGGDGVRAARVTACEVSKPRAEKLEHNLAKLGAKNVQVMRTDASKLDDWFSFDQILLNAPCTGSGTVHVQDDHAARYLTPALASGVERSQRALIDKALRVLKPGGELVYSTCSVLARENEDAVSWALSRHKDCELVGAGLPAGALGSEEFSVPTLPCGLDGALTVCPSDLFEGFFLAKIRKLG